MTNFTVQFTLPEDNPVNKVRIRANNKGTTFFVPINYPNAHCSGYEEFFEAARVSGLLDLSTPLNNTNVRSKSSIIKKGDL